MQNLSRQRKINEIVAKYLSFIGFGRVSFEPLERNYTRL
jgi:hypothetical protein